MTATSRVPRTARLLVAGVAGVAGLTAAAVTAVAPAAARPASPVSTSYVAQQDPAAAKAAKDGRIWFTDGSTGQLVSTTATGGGRKTYPGAAIHPAVSPDGTRVAFEFPTNHGIGLENADGTGTQTLVPDTGSSPSWSPDGTQIAFSDGVDIKVVTVSTGVVTALTHDGSATEEVSPAWSANGTWIAFTLRQCQTSGARCIVRINAADGSGRVNLTPFSGETNTSDEADWGPDNRIVYSSGIGAGCSAGGINVWRMTSSGSAKADLSCNPGVYDSDTAPTWSPSGRRIAFESDERVDTSYRQLYVMGSDGSGITEVDTGSRFGIVDPDWAVVPADQSTTLTLTASPTTVASGGKVKLSGRLTPASGQGYGGQKVTLSSAPAGSTTYTVVKTVRTTATGAWTTTVSPTASTSYRVSYEANSALGFGASTSPVVTVTVR